MAPREWLLEPSPVVFGSSEVLSSEEDAGRYFMVDAGTLRLRVEAVDGDVHRVGSTDPVVAFEVASVTETLAELATREVYAHRGPFMGPQGASAELRDPDGRAILLAEQA